MVDLVIPPPPNAPFRSPPAAAIRSRSASVSSQVCFAVVALPASAPRRRKSLASSFLVALPCWQRYGSDRFVALGVAHVNARGPHVPKYE
jgi:hypothetical protein